MDRGKNFQPKSNSFSLTRTQVRLEADRLFDRIMEQENISAWRRAIAYRAVRLFGGLGSSDWNT